MTLLSPWALLWLGSIPVLLWLWRMHATQRQIQMSSLIPFERLLKRSPRRRTRLVVNLLFWLQLAALIGVALLLARPVKLTPHTRTVLVVLDTSASMNARRGGSSAFDQAKQALLSVIARKSATEQLFLMTTSPIRFLLPQPTSDAAALAQTIHQVRVSATGGNISTAARIGTALLGSDPEETVVITDEPAPAKTPDRVRWIGVGEPLGNAAIVGVDAQGPLCDRSDARVLVTVQNFSREPEAVVLRARHADQPLATAASTLGPQARNTLSLEIPDRVTGLVELVLEAPHDHLELDNHAWVALDRSASLPIVIRSTRPAFERTVSAWLDACPALAWTVDHADGGPAANGSGPTLVITDTEDAASSAAATMTFLPSAKPRRIVSHWMVTATHPISSYMAPIEVVPASLNLDAPSPAGIPVISALVNGQKVPIIVADERDGRRIVSFLAEPMDSAESIPALLTFFNSLRWLMGRAETQLTGNPFIVNGVTPGPVTVLRPDGRTDTLSTDGHTLRYDATTSAGPYRVAWTGGSPRQESAPADPTATHAPNGVTVVVNFFDPMESDLLNRTSTWRTTAALPSPKPAPDAGGQAAAPAPAPSKRPSLTGHQGHTVQPLSRLVTIIVLILVSLEWWRYSLKRSARQPQPAK